MTVRANLIWLLSSSVLLGACAGSNQCTEQMQYQKAVAGTHVKTPDGLDPLAPEREVPVPKASPQAPPPPGTCLDAPPTLRTGSSDK